MKTRQLAITAVAISLGLVCVGTKPAQAAQLFNFSFSGNGVDASGTLTTTDLDSTTNSYTVTGISGTLNGQSLSIVPTSAGSPDPDDSTAYDYPPNPDFSKRYFFYDNQLLNPNSSPLLTPNGILFTVGSVADPANIFFDEGYQYLSNQYLSDVNTRPVPVSFTVTPVPEPVPVVSILIAGGIGVLMKKKKVSAEKVKA